MNQILLILVGGSFSLIAALGSIFVLANEHSPWAHALEAAGLLLCAGISILMLAAVGMLKVGVTIREFARRRNTTDARRGLQ